MLNEDFMDDYRHHLYRAPADATGTSLPMATYRPQPAMSASSAPPDATGALVNGVMKTNPYIAGAGLGLQAIGTGMSIYGAFKSQDEADRNYELAVRNFEAQKARAEEQARRQREETDLQRAYGLSTYSSEVSDRDRGETLRYNQLIGR